VTWCYDLCRHRTAGEVGIIPAQTQLTQNRGADLPPSKIAHALRRYGHACAAQLPSQLGYSRHPVRSVGQAPQCSVYRGWRQSSPASPASASGKTARLIVGGSSPAPAVAQQLPMERRRGRTQASGRASRFGQHRRQVWRVRIEGTRDEKTNAARQLANQIRSAQGNRPNARDLCGLCRCQTHRGGAVDAILHAWRS
jgi:hypothetical protein